MLSHDRESDADVTKTPVSTVMTPDPKRVTADQPVQDAAFIMREQDCGLVPVVDDDDRLVGVVTDRDLVLRVMCAGLRPDETRVEEAMTHRVHKAKAEDSVSEVHKIMSTHQVRRVPVVNEAGRLTGIVALADVARQCETPQTLGMTVERISLEPGEH
jgi:CBS domain-containing protein